MLEEAERVFKQLHDRYPPKEALSRYMQWIVGGNSKGKKGLHLEVQH